MTAHLPLHLTLTFWCMLDMGINAFILANLILCQELISEGMFTHDSSYPYPTIGEIMCNADQNYNQKNIWLQNS